ncbi:MAG: alpha/beta fold hydrolase [Holosporaceae bacterium]|jgi:pimeloyl-ACP methyl ester carboxylesterase
MTSITRSKIENPLSGGGGNNWSYQIEVTDMPDQVKASSRIKDQLNSHGKQPKQLSLRSTRHSHFKRESLLITPAGLNPETNGSNRKTNGLTATHLPAQFSLNILHVGCPWKNKQGELVPSYVLKDSSQQEQIKKIIEQVNLQKLENVGRKVYFIHGGPGSGCGDNGYFPPYTHGVYVNQRGAGIVITPENYSQLIGKKCNTTTDLASDFIYLLEQDAKAGEQKPIIYGLSYGGGVATMIAAKRPELIGGMVLQGPFFAREQDWHHTEVALKDVIPDAWNEFVEYIHESDFSPGLDPSHYTHRDIARGYHQLFKTALFEQDYPTLVQAVCAYTRYEDACEGQEQTPPEKFSKIYNDFDDPTQQKKLKLKASRVLIMTSYMENDGFLQGEAALEGLERACEVPTTLIYSQADNFVTPNAVQAFQEKLPNAGIVRQISHPHLHEESLIYHTREMVNHADEMREVLQNLR